MQPIKSTFELSLIPHEEMAKQQTLRIGTRGGSYMDIFTDNYYILKIDIDLDDQDHELSFTFSEIKNDHCYYRFSHSRTPQSGMVDVHSVLLTNPEYLLSMLTTLFTMKTAETEMTGKEKIIGIAAPPQDFKRKFPVYKLEKTANTSDKEVEEHTSNIEKTNSAAEGQTLASGNVDSFTLSRLLKYFCERDMTSEEGLGLKTGLMTLHSRLETHYAAQVQTHYAAPVQTQVLQKVLSEQFGRMSRDVPPPPTNPEANLSSSPEWTGEQPKPSTFFHLTPNNK